jgi:hypothetical protein
MELGLEKIKEVVLIAMVRRGTIEDWWWLRTQGTLLGLHVWRRRSNEPRGISL